jgi:hypothetical protein
MMLRFLNGEEWFWVFCVSAAGTLLLAAIIAGAPSEADMDRFVAKAQDRRAANCADRWAPRDTKVVGLTCVVRLKDGWVPEDAISVRVPE